MRVSQQADRIWGRGAVVAGLIVLGAFCSTYFLNPTFISHETDWLQYPARYGFARECWLAGAPPLWCHYFGGGYFIAGDPDGQTLTLITPFVLLFGEIVGLKAALVAAHLVAFTGMFYLMRCVWQLPTLASVYAGLLLSLSTWLPGRIFQGNWPEMYYAASPWLVALYLRGVQRPVFALWLGAVLGVILPQARQGWAALMLFLSVLATVDCLRRRRLEGIMVVAAAFVAALFVGAVKLLPASCLLAKGIPLQASRDLYGEHAITALHWARFRSGIVGNELDILRHQSSEMCIGHAGAALALVGLVVAWRRAWTMGLVWFVFAWLMMAWRAPVDLFHYLHSLPVFGTIMNPIRDFNYFLALCSAGLAGLAASAGWRTRGLRWVVAIVCAVSIGQVCRESLGYHRFLFPHSPPQAVRTGAFEQVYCLVEPRWADRPTEGNAYFNLVKGVGTVNHHTSLALPEFVQPKRFIDRWARGHANSRYRGEAYGLVSGIRGQLTFPKPNRLRVRVALPQDELVVVNQNHHPSWTASKGEVVSHNGSLALRLPAGEHDVELRFSSWRFGLGAAISLASIALCAAASVMSQHSRRLRHWPASLTFRRRHALAALLVLGGACWLVLRPRVAADSLVAEAVACLTERNFDLAAQRLGKAAELRPRDPAILRRLGISLMRSGRLEASLGVLGRAVATAPGDLEARLELIRAFCAAGQPEAALEHALDVSSRAPLNWLGHFWQASALCQLRRMGEAEDALARAAELGMSDAAMVRSFPLLAPLKERPAFERIIESMRARYDSPVASSQ